MPANDALRLAMESAGHSNTTLGVALGVDPKSIQRWRTEGRTPHPGTANRAATILGVDVGTIWPALAERAGFVATAQIVRFYPHRSLVPKGLWSELAEQATERIEFLTYASLFFGEEAPDAIDLMRAKAATGVRVRMNLGDPDSPQVELRTQEEGIAIAERIRTALHYYRPLLGAPGVEFHVHRTTLYNSIYRFDDDLLVNQHALGVHGYQAPILHLRAPGDLVDLYARSFEQAWSESVPYEPTSTGPSVRTYDRAANAA